MNRSPVHRLMLIAAGVGMLSCAEPRSRTVPDPIPTPRVGRPDLSGPEDQVDRVIQAHQSERARRGLSPLGPNPALAAAARAHARDMADRRKMAHKGGDGSSPFDRIKRMGYDFGSAAENVAYGFEDSESVMAGWMNSPGHRRNILGRYAEIGVGRAIAIDGASYWCVTFGTPAGP